MDGNSNTVAPDVQHLKWLHTRASFYVLKLSFQQILLQFYLMDQHHVHVLFYSHTVIFSKSFINEKNLLINTLKMHACFTLLEKRGGLNIFRIPLTSCSQIFSHLIYLEYLFHIITQKLIISFIGNGFMYGHTVIFLT